MADELQHCEGCQEEYVAGVAACVECGGTLQAGPLPRAGRSRAGVAASAAAGASDLDRLLVELPGLQADLAVRALLLEDIPVRVVCQKNSKVYAAGEKPTEPFAVTLPVSVFVSAAQLDMAQEILDSMQRDDVIGDQWSDPQSDTEGNPIAVESDAASEEPEDDIADEARGAAPRSESTSLRAVVILVVAGLILLFMFGR